MIPIHYCIGDDSFLNLSSAPPTVTSTRLYQCVVTLQYLDDGMCNVSYTNTTNKTTTRKILTKVTVTTTWSDQVLQPFLKKNLVCVREIPTPMCKDP